MTKLDNDGAALTGEQRLKAKRRKWWRYLTIAMLFSLVAGLAIGFSIDLFVGGAVPIWLPVIALVIVLGGMVWFSWDFFQRVDEVDLMDNLWAHLIGLYAGLFIFMGWYFLSELGITTYPNAFGVIGTMLVATFIAYGIRKLGFR